MRQAIQELQPQGAKPGQAGLLWPVFLSALMTLGGLLGLNQTFGAATPGLRLPILAAFLALLCCLLGRALRGRYPVLTGLAALPWLVLVILAGPTALWRGGKLWLNDLFTRWNQAHDGAMALFQVEGSLADLVALACLLAVACGCAVWFFVAGRRVLPCGLVGAFVVLLQLLGGSFSPLACALFLGAFLGLWITRDGGAPSRRGVFVWLAGVVLLALGAFWGGGTTLASVDQWREDVTQTVHDLRYGETVLPLGDLRQAEKLNESEAEMLTVHTGQEKNLYLRGYVGADYRGGVWSPLPNLAYAGENAGMLDWLHEQGFDPLTQSAAYYRLSGAGEQPEENTLSIQISGAARDRLYFPASLAALPQQSDTTRRGEPSALGVKSAQDTTLTPKGLTGPRSYAETELSGSRPAELTVAAEWVTAPGNEEQNRYCQAETVYRDFVYRTYTTVDAQLADLLQDLFWRDYDTEGDGVYRALRQVRDTLSARVTYTKTPQTAPADEDPIRWFLTESRAGNDVFYAAAAVQALRAHGIPARYAEGYYLSAADVAGSSDGTVTLTGQNAHAWVEVYFDGVGWLPTDVTPGYYYDTVALQQMVGTPDTVRKTAALQDDQTGAEGVTGEDSGGGEQDVTPREIAKNSAIVLAGLAGLCLLAVCVVLLVLEVMRAVVLWRLTKQFRAADAVTQIVLLEGQIFTFLALWGHEASLGWHTEALDETLSKEFTAIEPGEFRRVSRLMEQAVYGGLALEEYETRAVRSFLAKLSLIKPGDTWKTRRKLRYGWLPCFAKRLHQQKSNSDYK